MKNKYKEHNNRAKTAASLQEIFRLKNIVYAT